MDAGGRRRASAGSPRPARSTTRSPVWALGVALALTWISGLDYFRLAPRLLRGDTGRAAGQRRLGAGLGVLEQPGEPPDAAVGLGARIAVGLDRGQERGALFGGRLRA